MKNKDYALLASICRDVSNSLNAILYKNSKATCQNLSAEMLRGTVNNKCPDTKILVLFDYSMALDLKEVGFNNVYFTTDCPEIIRKTKEGLEAKTKIKVITLEEIKNMKFDVGLGNPPFSEVGATGTTGSGMKSLLYPKFFKIATEVCKVGAMIMPPTKVNHSQIKHHNELIKSIAHEIIHVSEEEKNNMGVGIDMWTIYWGSEGNVNEHFIEQDVKNDVDWQRGKPRFSNINMSEKKTGTHKVLSIKSILQEGPVFIYSDIVKYIQKKGWYVVFNFEVNGAKGFNTSVIKLDGKTQLGSNIRYVKFDTKKDAIEFESKMNAPDFIAACHEAAGTIRKTVTIGALRSIAID